MIETCRICLDQDLSTNLVAPCKCAGTQRYVHPNCLGRWQQTMLDSILENPETLSPERVEKCYVCKTRYINYKRTFGRLFKRQFKRVFTSYILLFVATGLLVLLFIPLILNLIAIIAICVLLCYWKEVRPSIFLVSSITRLLMESSLSSSEWAYSSLILL